MADDSFTFESNLLNMSSLPRISLCVALFIAFLGLAASCKKEPDPLPEKPTEAFAKTYLFKKDSWWAYVDSASGQRDTLVIDTTWSYSAEFIGLADNEHESRVLTNMDAHLGSMGSFRLTGDKVDNRFPYLISISSQLSTFFMVLGYDITSGSPAFIADIPDQIQLVDSLASLDAANQTIQKISVFRLDSSKWSIQTRPIFKKTWWAKNIGLVKFQNNQGQTFTLADYRAVPLWPLP